MKKFFPILLVLLFVLPAFAQEEVELSDAERDRIKAELDADEEGTGLSREELVEKYNGDGDCLWMIAETMWGWQRCAEWPRIYEVNKDLIKDPDLIYPGWSLNIPLDCS